MTARAVRRRTRLDAGVNSSAVASCLCELEVLLSESLQEVNRRRNLYSIVCNGLLEHNGLDLLEVSSPPRVLTRVCDNCDGCTQGCKASPVADIASRARRIQETVIPLIWSS